MNNHTAITLDVFENIKTFVFVKQDHGYSKTIDIYLTEDGNPVLTDSETDFLFRCKKPDGHMVCIGSDYFDENLGKKIVFKNNDGSVSVELVPQIMSTCGECICDLCTMKFGNIMYSFPFTISVIRESVNTDFVTSDDYIRTKLVS